jgi:hypothetical protein
MIDHDRLFKELLTTFFTDFVDLLLPDLSAYLDAHSLEFLDKEVFTDVTEGERHEADIVARVRFCSEASCFLVHVENQAQPQPEFARRMFRYFARLHERHALPVYPIVVFSYDSTRPEPDRYGVSFPDLEVLRFQFRSIQLRRLNWRDYLRRPNPVAAALMARMGMAEEERPRVKLECLRLLTTLRLDPARMKLISGFIDTYLRGRLSVSGMAAPASRSAGGRTRSGWRGRRASEPSKPVVRPGRCGWGQPRSAHALDWSPPQPEGPSETVSCALSALEPGRNIAFRTRGRYSADHKRKNNHARINQLEGRGPAGGPTGRPPGRKRATHPPAVAPALRGAAGGR